MAYARRKYGRLGDIGKFGILGGYGSPETGDSIFNLAATDYGNAKIKPRICPTGQRLVNGVCKPITTTLTGKKCKDGSSPPCPEDEIPEDGKCPDGTIGKPPNCIPIEGITTEEIKKTFDRRFDGPVTVADIGKVRTDPITGQTITDTGLNTGDYRLDYSPYGAEERGQGRGTVYGDPLMSANDARLLRSFWNPYADIGKEFLNPFANQATQQAEQQDAYEKAAGILRTDQDLRDASETISVLDSDEKILNDKSLHMKNTEKRIQRELKRIADDKKRLEEARRIEEERLLAEANRMRGRQDAGGDDETAEDEKPSKDKKDKKDKKTKKTKKEKTSKTKVTKPTGRSAALALAASLASGKKSPTKSSARGGPGTKSKAAKGRQPRGGQHR